MTGGVAADLKSGKAWAKAGLRGGVERMGRRYRPKDCYRRALELDPSYAEAWVLLGARGGGEVFGHKYERSACCRHALELEPDYALAWVHLGRLGGGAVAGHHYAPVDCFRRALEIRPNDFSARRELCALEESPPVASPCPHEAEDDLSCRTSRADTDATSEFGLVYEKMEAL